MRVFVVLSAAIGVLSMTSSAAAQDKVESAKNAKMESWIFPDDKLLNVAPGDSDMKIFAGRRVVRTILSRPRTHFVPELLKTIETL
jgi:hypothetical protein